MKSTVMIIIVTMVNYCWLFYIFIYCKNCYSKVGTADLRMKKHSG